MTTENPDAVALLREAFDAIVDVPPDMPVAGGYEEAWSILLNWNSAEGAASLLLAHPRLARVVALGLAWVRAEEALPEGWRMALEASSPADVDLPPYRAMAQEFDNFGSKVVNGFAPTPEAALIALAEKIGGSK